MHARVPALAVGLLLASPIFALLSAQSAVPAPAQPISFDKDVKPLLEQHCLSCHGETDAVGQTRSAQPRQRLEGRGARIGHRAGRRRREPALSTRRRARAAGDAGAGRAAAGRQIAAIKQWIDEGAAWAIDARPSTSTALEHRTDHCRRAELLGVQAAGQGAAAGRRATRASPTRSIDFSKARARARGLTAAPRADRYTLVRRAYLDLLGLPPTPAQVDAFVADDRRTPGSGSSTRCSPRRTTANATAGTGSTSRATPTRPASSTTCTGPTPGATATT